MTMNGYQNVTQHYAGLMVTAINQLERAKANYIRVLHDNGVNLKIAKEEANRVYEAAWQFMSHIEDEENLAEGIM